MQADGGLVQHVHHPHQPRADLAGQADPLRLAPGQGFGAALQGQVFQPHVDQKLQPVTDLLENLFGDLPLAAGQVEFAEVIMGLAHGQSHHIRQGGLLDKHMSSSFAKT